MATPTDRFILAEQRLGSDLGEFLRRCRTEGKSFNSIAFDLSMATGGDVKVTPQTISNWLDRLDEAVA